MHIRIVVFGLLGLGLLAPFAGILDLDADGYCPSTVCMGNLLPGDCDDTDSKQHPGAPELCNGEDDDCDGDLNERDADNDGFAECPDYPNYSDCDDGNPAVYPHAVEVCNVDGDGNDIDDDCSGKANEGFDVDGDGYYNVVCAGDTGGVDCDDRRADIHPGIEEQCGNGRDDDCDGAVDEAYDEDGDGYSPCSEDESFYDCDDTDPSVHSEAEEVCNNRVDDNCNGLIDVDCTP